MCSSDLGAAKRELEKKNVAALERGLPNLLRHVENITRVYGLPAVVAINSFETDTSEELALVEAGCRKLGVNVVLSEVWAKGGNGGIALAEEVVRLCESYNAFKFSYSLDQPLEEKIKEIAHKIYRADDIVISASAKKEIDMLVELGFGELPICIAKTQYSFSDDRNRPGAPENFKINVSKVKVSAGAGFIVVFTGDIIS